MMKIYSEREFAKILSNNGYRQVRTRGSHRIYQKEGRTLCVNNNVKPVIAYKLIRQYGLEV